MARAPGRPRLPAPGHPPARLRPEEPEAGIQARGLRALQPAARRGEDGRHPHPDDGAHPEPGAGGRSGRGHRGPCRGHQQRHLHPPGRGRQRGPGGRCEHLPWRRPAQGRPQRPLPLRQRQEVQAVPWQADLIAPRR
ncbi:hypothetical protein LJR028_002870 [Rhizobacter sp. LjRoot28]